MIAISKPLIGKEEIKAVREVMLSGMLAQGIKVKEFEDDFAKYIGVKYAIATSNGTTALHLAIMSLNLNPGDEVITTPFSFIASSNCLLYCGLKPVFVDINESDFGINSDLIEKKITDKTKAILVVHIFGQSVDMKKICDIATRHNLKIVEDACQAHGATYNGLKLGSIGDIACFSFYPTKNMTCGEGGMILTNNNKVNERLRVLRNHGQTEKYFHSILGFNFRMTDICAAIGIVQLKKLEKFNIKRLLNARYFTKHLKHISGLVCPTEFNERLHVYHQYSLRILDSFNITRDNFILKLRRFGIDVHIYYPVLIPNQKCYRDLGYQNKFPVADKICKEIVSIPIHPGLTKQNLVYIVKKIKFFSTTKRYD
jgi:dTDP-4-amino-4,6-dideoxygalactose transaminase